VETYWIQERQVGILSTGLAGVCWQLKICVCVDTVSRLIAELANGETLNCLGNNHNLTAIIALCNPGGLLSYLTLYWVKVVTYKVRAKLQG
jgi:hypothetical protein